MKLISKAIQICYICTAFSITLCGQDKISIEEYLNKNIQQTIVNKNLTQSEKFPWINEYELRTETDDLDFAKQEYTLRLSPSSSKVKAAQQSIYKHLTSLPNSKEQEIYCDMVNESFERIISLYLAEELLETYKTWEVVIADKQLVLSKLAGSLDFDHREILDLLELQTKVKYNKEKLLIEKNTLSEKSGLKTYSIDFSSLIKITDITSILDTEEIKDAEHILTQEDQYDLDLVKKELELEVAERKQYLDFVQLKYRGPHDNPFEERFSIGLGLKLPNSGNQKLKIKELEIEQANIMNKAKAEQTLASTSISQIQQDLTLKILYAKEYMELIEQEGTALKSLAEQIARNSEFDPLLLLDINERQIETKIKSLSLQEDVYDEYLDYLKERGIACNQKTNIAELISSK